MQINKGFQASITVKISKEIKQQLKEIAEASGGQFTISELVRMFIYEGLDSRGMLPKNDK